MVRKLTSDLVSQHWDKIKLAIVYPFDPQPRDPELFLNRFLSLVLQDKAAIWIGLSPKTRDGDLKSQTSDEEKVRFVCATMDIVDPCSLEKHLMIYSLYGYTPVPEILWKELVDALIVFGKDSACRSIVGYSSVPRVIEIAKSVGLNTDTHYIKLNLEV